jgi:hypothetical protein
MGLSRVAPIRELSRLRSGNVHRYHECHIALIHRFESAPLVAHGPVRERRTRQRAGALGAVNVPSAPGCDTDVPPRDASASAPPARAPNTAAIHVAMTNRRDDGTRMVGDPRNAWTAPARPESIFPAAHRGYG